MSLDNIALPSAAVLLVISLAETGFIKSELVEVKICASFGSFPRYIKVPPYDIHVFYILDRSILNLHQPVNPVGALSLPYLLALNIHSQKG